MRVQGWWTYEWCHQSHVRQFHRDADGTVTSDWSLGQFDALGSMKLDVKASHDARQPLFIHKFEGGQVRDAGSLAMGVVWPRIVAHGDATNLHRSATKLARGDALKCIFAAATRTGYALHVLWRARARVCVCVADEHMLTQ